jgi:CdiI immunity protein
VNRTIEYPAISAFVRGYLHQDAAEEFGSALAAAKQFCRDANASQVYDLRGEWARFQNRYRHLGVINRELQQLGCAWVFPTIEEFRQMLNVIFGATEVPEEER